MSWTVPGVVVRVIDADTIVVNLDLGWRVYRNREHVRIDGVNAPERGTAEGDFATAKASEWLYPGRPVMVESTGKPSFERTVGKITVDGRDYGDWLVRQELAVRV